VQVDINELQVDIAQGQACSEALAGVLSKKKFKQVMACKCDQALLDLASPVPPGCTTVEPITPDSPEGLHILRHSAAHLMAQAVKKLFPAAKVTIGPAIENGFYYDFDFERSFTPEDLQVIEKAMQESVEADLPFERKEMGKDQARKLFSMQNETYKLEMLDDMEDERVSIYTLGSFTDLCRGPHVPSTRFLGAFKLTSVAGAYWRGDENKPMLQRIYGTAWSTPKELKSYLNRLEEAKKRDHRKLGAQLDLFHFSEEAGPGMPIFHPKGALLRTILEDFETREHLKRGYELVRGPQLLRLEMWKKSGHFDNYRENMYFSEIDDQVYGIKPMNCLSHMLIYKSQIRSYRDIPISYFELGTVHRHEKSGVLHGLMRVRQFTQDDAHILCQPEQLQDEIIGIVKFVQDLMDLFGFEYVIEISTRPEKSIGTDQAWQKSTQALHQALDALGLDYSICAGDGAFYGPKIDVKLKDALDRLWQCSTIQCDFNLPERFDLTYVGQDGERHRPVMLHRTILGAIERFLGVFIEHTAGALPAWIAPVQARVLNITDEQRDYADACAERLRAADIRIESDLRNEKLGYKVREAQMAKIPYILVAGDREKADSMLNVRLRSGENKGALPLADVQHMITEDSREPFKRGGMSYSFSQ